MTATERRNTRRRRDRAAERLATTPEGRELLAREAATIEGARAAAGMISRAVPEFREVLGAALDAYAESCGEYAFQSPTARRFALQAALFSTAATHLLGDSFEAGARTMAGTRSAKNGDGVTATLAIAGFRDLAGLAAAFVTKSQIAIETAWRCEDRSRLEARDRDRHLMARARTAYAATATPMLPSTDTRVSVEGEDDDGRTVDVRPSEADDATPVREAPAAARGPHEPTSTGDEREVTPPGIELATWCVARRKMVPASVASTPAISASDGPDWPERQRREDEVVARWEAQVRDHRNGLTRAAWETRNR